MPVAAPRRVHVVGPVFFDLVFSGLSGSPGPGTEVRSSHLGSAPGGAANIAVALARLGVEVSLGSVFADDMYARWLMSTLNDEGIDLSWSAQHPGWTTPVTVSVAYGGERSMVTHEAPWIEGPGLPDPVPAGVDAVCVLTGAGDDRDLSAYREPGRLVCADIGWDPEEVWAADLLTRLEGIDLFLPNRAEALAYTRTDDTVAAARRLAQAVDVAVVTEGAGGAVAAHGDEIVHVPSLRVEAVDPTGAGDVFDAGFIYASISGWPLERRLLFAVLCAGQSVRWSGGSLSAPCWLDLAAWWAETERDPVADVAGRYGFLPAAIAQAPAGRPCRRPSATITAAALATAGLASQPPAPPRPTS